MADLEFTVAMVGQQQAEKGLDALAKKSNEVVRSEKIREKATKDANAAAAKQVGGAAKVVGRLGGGLAQVGGLGEAANRGPVMGRLALAAAVAAASFKALSDSLNRETTVALQRADNRIKAAMLEDRAAAMRGASGVKALESQGANLVRLESLGPAFTELANKLTVAAPRGMSFSAADTQAAVLKAAERDITVQGVSATVEAARKLATLTGDSLAASVAELQKFGRLGTGNDAIAAILSQREGASVTSLTVENRLRAVEQSKVAQEVIGGRRMQAMTSLAEQEKLPFAMEALTRQFVEVQQPLMMLQADAIKENTLKLQALGEALSEQGAFMRFLDMMVNQQNSLIGQYGAVGRALEQGRSNPMGEIR